MAGLASLFSFPALLAVGLPATAANVTNSVALIFSSAGSVAASRPELAGQSSQLRRLLPIAVLGGICGSVVLLLTPDGLFEFVVPVFIAGASMVLLLQPRLRAAAARRRLGSGVQRAGLLLVGFYGGYFGAAAGVILLALLLVTTPLGVQQANAYKNVLLGAANAVAAAGFVLFGAVVWWAVPPLAVGALAGATVGPRLVRRTSATVLRVGVGLAGLLLAARLGWTAYS